MIRNKRQYIIAKKQADKFMKSMIEFDNKEKINGCPSNIHPLVFKAQRQSLVSLLHELELDINEYNESTIDNQS